MPNSVRMVADPTSSIASSPVIIPPRSVQSPKQQRRASLHLGARAPAIFHALRKLHLLRLKERAIRTIQAAPLVRRNTAGPALESAREGSRLGKVERGRDLSERQLRVRYELPGDFESEFVEHGPEARACRFEVAIYRAPMDGKPARDLLTRAVTRGQTLPQAAFQLIDKIGAGNRLQLANCSLKSKPELRVGCAHFRGRDAWPERREPSVPD